MMFDLGPRLGTRDHDPLRHVLNLKPPGHAVEFGVARGITLRLIAATMPVTGFDSFDGLPETWRPGFPAGYFACDIPNIPGADIVVGLFSDTLPTWTPPAPLGLVHIDCDLYSSTVTVLHYLRDHLHPGCYIVFDEFHSYPGWEHGEAKAWTEFLEDNPLPYEVLGHGREQWAIKLT